MSTSQRTLIWRGLDDPSMEFFTLRQMLDGWQLAGTIVAVENAQPLRVGYVIDCAADWHTRNVELSLTDAEGERTLSLRASGTGDWLVGDHRLDAVAGCIDIDLGITPATNTLPIRRLNLAVGESAAVVATWVRFPSLTIQTLSQRYTRIAEHRYHYASDPGFECDLVVDDDGLIATYPEGWERVE